MPGWLQGFVTHQPLGVLIDASRALMVGGPTASLVGQSLAWTAGIFVVFMPIAVWRYRERS